MVGARDGAKVPVSVVYKKGFEKDGEGKLFLYAYGAYGTRSRRRSTPTGSACSTAAGPTPSPTSAAATTSATNGSSTASSTKRTNTFNDFVDVGERADRGEVHRPGRIAINGGSAGGELMGAVANTDPDLWGAVVADVPFVDVLNTCSTTRCR